METRLRHSSYLAAISHHISPEGFPSLYKPKHTDKTQLLGPGFPLYKACLAKTAANLAGSAFHSATEAPSGLMGCSMLGK